MKKKTQKILLVCTMVLVNLFFVLGCGGLKGFDPASPDEAAIRTLFLSMERAWNEKDANGVLSAYHNSAKIMTGEDRQMLSKEEYAKTLTGLGLKRAGSIKYERPRIKFSEDRADAEVNIITTLLYHNITLWTKFFLVRSGGGWLILKRTYTY